MYYEFGEDIVFAAKVGVRYVPQSAYELESRKDFLLRCKDRGFVRPSIKDLKSPAYLVVGRKGQDDIKITAVKYGGDRAQSPAVHLLTAAQAAVRAVRPIQENSRFSWTYGKAGEYVYSLNVWEDKEVLPSVVWRSQVLRLHVNCWERVFFGTFMVPIKYLGVSAKELPSDCACYKTKVEVLKPPPSQYGWWVGP